MNTDNPRTFVMPARDVKLVAVFEPKEVEPTPTLFTLTVEGGTGSGRFEQGAIIEISATIPEGMRFIRWSDGEVMSTRSFIMPAHDVVLSAELEPIPTFVLTVNGGTGGGTFEAGTVRTLTATVPTGRRFIQWSDGNFQNPRQFTMPANNVTLTAEFSFILTVNGGIGGGDFAAGTVRGISAQPPQGQQFVRWSDGNTDEHRTIVMPPNDLTLTAEFEVIQLFTLLTMGASGTGLNYVTTSGGIRLYTGQFTAGAQIMLTPQVPPTGKQFAKWEDGSTSVPRTLIMPARNAEVVAEFEATPIQQTRLVIRDDRISNTLQRPDGSDSLDVFVNGGNPMTFNANWTHGNLSIVRQSGGNIHTATAVPLVFDELNELAMYTVNLPAFDGSDGLNLTFRLGINVAGSISGANITRGVPADFAYEGGTVTVVFARVLGMVIVGMMEPLGITFNL